MLVNKFFITLVFSVNPFSHGGFPVSCLTAVGGHMRQSHKGNIGEIKDSLGVCDVHFYAWTSSDKCIQQERGGGIPLFSL